MNSSESERFLKANLKSLLQEKLWLLDERFKQKRMKTPYKLLTDAESRILAALRGETINLSEIARRLSLSRQAVHKTVSKLVEAGLLELEPIAGNARDKSIRFTEKGEDMKNTAHETLQELEKDVEAVIGQADLTLLKTILSKTW